MSLVEYSYRTVKLPVYGQLGCEVIAQSLFGKKSLHSGKACKFISDVFIGDDNAVNLVFTCEGFFGWYKSGAFSVRSIINCINNALRNASDWKYDNIMKCDEDISLVFPSFIFFSEERGTVEHHGLHTSTFKVKALAMLIAGKTFKETAAAVGEENAKAALGTALNPFILAKREMLRKQLENLTEAYSKKREDLTVKYERLAKNLDKERIQEATALNEEEATERERLKSEYEALAK